MCAAASVNAGQLHLEQATLDGTARSSYYAGVTTVTPGGVNISETAIAAAVTPRRRRRPARTVGGWFGSEFVRAPRCRPLERN